MVVCFVTDVSFLLAERDECTADESRAVWQGWRRLVIHGWHGTLLTRWRLKTSTKLHQEGRQLIHYQGLRND